MIKVNYQDVINQIGIVDNLFIDFPGEFIQALTIKCDGNGFGEPKLIAEWTENAPYGYMSRFNIKLKNFNFLNFEGYKYKEASVIVVYDTIKKFHSKVKIYIGYKRSQRRTAFLQSLYRECRIKERNIIDEEVKKRVITQTCFIDRRVREFRDRIGWIEDDFSSAYSNAIAGKLQYGTNLSIVEIQKYPHLIEAYKELQKLKSEINHNKLTQLNNNERMETILV